MKKILLGILLFSTLAFGEGRIRNADIATNASIAPSKIASGTFNGTFNGNASTATALATNPTDCSTPGTFATGIDTQGNLTCASAFTSPLGVTSGGTGTTTQFTAGSVVFAGASGVYSQDNSNFFWDDSANRLGLFTTNPSYDFSLGGDAARTIRMENHTTADTAGNNLTVRSGGANSASTDKNGGTLLLISGDSRGTGTSSISFSTATPQTSSSSTVNNPTVKMTLLGTGFFGVGTSNPTAKLTVAGAQSGTPGSSGDHLVASAHTFTDSNTASSGTVSNYASSVIGATTLAATNTTVTTTNASNLRINGAVLPSTNETITNTIALHIPTTAVGSGAGTAVNAYSMLVAAPSGATTGNYAASFTGSVGFGGVLDPTAPISIAAQGVTVGTHEQISLRSQRAAIVSGDSIGGFMFKSNDTQITAPGNNVALINAVASATHSSSVNDTDLTFQTTSTLTMSEKMIIKGSGNVGIATSSPGSKLHVAGSYQGAVTAITSNTTLDGTHQYVTADATSGAIAVTLPDCVAAIIGRVYHIKKIDSSSNAITLTRTGSDDTFDGVTSKAFSVQYEAKTVVCASTTLWAIY